MLIKNFDSLITTPQRKVALEIVEAGLNAIAPESVLKTGFKVNGSKLTVAGQEFELESFDRIFLLGFGKGSAEISRLIEEALGSRLTGGRVIDLIPADYSRVKFTLGTHPLPSEINQQFTRETVAQLGELTKKDLVLVVICGGGSAMLTDPKVPLAKFIEINRVLLKSGASISEMNVVRKHLDGVKGGNLAAKLYPATVVSLIFSDVPGNDLSTIASGPTVLDPSTIENAISTSEKYHLGLVRSDFTETPKENKFFEKVFNLLVLSNLTALSAMEDKARELGYKVRVYSDHLQGAADGLGKELIDQTDSSEVLLAGGESTVLVRGDGEGGRNQELVLASLPFLKEGWVIISVGSDGWDNTEVAGAIGDVLTCRKADGLNLSPKKFLINNNSFSFFQKVGDAIVTGKLPSNVSDLMVVLKNA